MKMLKFIALFVVLFLFQVCIFSNFLFANDITIIGNENLSMEKVEKEFVEMNDLLVPFFGTLASLFTIYAVLASIGRKNTRERDEKLSLLLDNKILSLKDSISKDSSKSHSEIYGSLKKIESTEADLRSRVSAIEAKLKMRGK